MSRSRSWSEVSPEEIEQADRFFEELLGAPESAWSERSHEASPEEIEQADRFFEALMGRPPRARTPRWPRTEGRDHGEATPGPRRVSPSATVRWLQQAIGPLVSPPLVVDGVLGPQTRAAVRQFQQQQGLRSDGRLLATVLHRIAARSGTLPPGVWPGSPPVHQGRAPDLSTPCDGAPTVLERFAFGSATPTAEHRAAIAALAQSIAVSQSSTSPVHLVCLTGHTDGVGGHGPNERLGQRRAEAVQDELVAALERTSPGLAVRLGLWSTSAGETEPIAPETSEASRARNRRVEVRQGRRWRAPHGTTTVTITAEGVAVDVEDQRAGEQNPTTAIQIPMGRAVRLRATGSPLPVGDPAYTWTSASPGIASVMRVGTTQAHPSPADVRGVTPGTTTISVEYRPATGAPSTASVSVIVTAPTVPAVDRYGCHDLRRGDRDQDPSNGNRPRWGGQAGAAATICQPPPASPPASPQHVRQLQDDLRSLGFLIVGNPSGTFDRNTAWAVREFQIYAKMDLVARVRPGVAAHLRQGAHVVAAANGHDATANLSEYVSSLEATGNTAPYPGPISGVVDAATRAALDHWLRSDWRCPVVIEAWTTNRSGARTAPVAINLWAHDAHTTTRPRMFARDFTNYYAFPAGRNADDMHVIGDFAQFTAFSGADQRTFRGPRSEPPSHTFAEAELLPAALVGNAAPTGSTLSTYRVVRAAAEQENIGFFDCVNAYDNAFVSLGPCHWTLGIVARNRSVSEGELCGYFAYLRHVDPAAFFRAIEFFGVRVDESWVSAAGPADGADMFSSGQRKYHGWMAAQQQNGTFTRLTLGEADGDYFKTWHWHYRFVMAGRTIDGYRRRMWDMARVRLRDIRSVAWGTGVAQVGTGAAARPATIGDVLTSERAIAMILRWHIFRPGHVCAGGTAGTNLRAALTAAQAAGASLDWTRDPSTWTDDHERHLVEAVRVEASRVAAASIQNVHDWPRWLGGSNPRGFTLAAPIAAPLASTRRSFDFDAAGLPPAPP